MYRNFRAIYILTAVLLIVLTYSCKTTRHVQVHKQPVQPPPVPEVKVPPVEVKPITEVNKTEKLNFTLILPFDLPSNFINSEAPEPDPEIKERSLQALNFYEGTLIAADSLKGMNKLVKVTACDAPSDSLSLARLLNSLDREQAGTVIATLPGSLAPAAAAIAEKNGLRLLLTQANTPKFLNNNNNTALAYASTFTQCREMVSTMMEKHPASKVILIYRNAKREDELAEAFRSQIRESGKNHELADLNLSIKTMKQVPEYLSKSARNIVFVVSSDEAFVSPLLSLIEEQAMYGVIVNGLPTWQNFESINFMSFKNIQVNIFDNNFIDYENPERLTLRKKFLDRYYTDPLPSGYNGFDLVFGIGSTTARERSSLREMIQAAFAGNREWFDFKQYENGGMENRKISVLRYVDYKLKPVSNY